ncbi:protein starmaker-like [Tetranychus urticae]|uniref:FAM21/CAPZIP domain-containing protein n=1 Tax=Tetranychus urticae TaxID=32264 RepID=T1JXV4_TETUR|nr:protein starmaker-like [Tetranychus urticae]
METTSGADQPFYLNDAETVTSDHLRSSDMRSLGDNVKLLAVIENLGSDLVSKSENAYKKIDEIDWESEVKSVAVKNLINEFQMLADSQFIENRIYDEDTIDVHGEISENPNADSSDNNKSSPDQKILPIIHECISNSLQFIDEKFDLPSTQTRQQNESDEEEDYVKEALAKAYENNPFNKTPLPSIIGSKEFFNQPLFNEGGNQTTETNPEYYSEPSDKFSDDNGELESQDSDEEEQNLFTTINDSIVNYPLNSSSLQTEKKLAGKDEVGILNGSKFSGGQKAETERKAIEKKPESLMDEFSDDDDEDDDDLFTTASSKVRTPIDKIRHNVQNTKEEKADEESKDTKVSIKKPSSNASEPIKSVRNSSARAESDDSSDDSLFNDFKSKLSKMLTNKPTDDKSDSKRVSREIRPPSISSTSSKDATARASTVQSHNNSSEKNLFSETSDDEKDDLFEIKNKSIAPSLVKKISDDDDDDDDDLFATVSSKVGSPIEKISHNVKNTKEEKADEESKVMEVANNIPSTNASEPIKSVLNNSTRTESDDSSDDSLFNDFKSKLSKILTNKPTNDKSDFRRVSKVIRPPSTSSTPSKDYAARASTVQSHNNSSEKNLFSETSDDEKDNFFENKNKSIASSIVKKIPDDDDDDDDDLFTTASPKVRPPIPKIRNNVKNTKEEKEDENSKVMKDPLAIQSIETSEQIKSAVNAASITLDDNDGDDDDLFKTVSVNVRPPTPKKRHNVKNTKEEIADEAKVMKVPLDIQSIKASEQIKPALNAASITLDDSDDDDDDLFKTVSPKVWPPIPKKRHNVKNNEEKADEESKVMKVPLDIQSIKTSEQIKSAVNAASSRLDDSDEDDDDLFKTVSVNVRPPTPKKRHNVKNTKEEKADEESQVMEVAINVPSSNASEPIKSVLNSSTRTESDDSSDDSLFNDFKSKFSKMLINKPTSAKSDFERETPVIRPPSTSSTSSKDYAVKKSTVQSHNILSEKNLFSETSDDEIDDLFEIKNKSIAPSIIKKFPDDDDEDDDDLFKTVSPKVRPPIPKIRHNVKNAKEDKADEESKVMKVPLNIQSTKTSEQIKSAVNAASSTLDEDDEDDDDLFTTAFAKIRRPNS